jgi:hypothetical protein
MAATAGMDAWSRLLAEATEGAGVLVKPGYDGMLALISEKFFSKKTLEAAFRQGGWSVDSSFTREEFVHLLAFCDYLFVASMKFVDRAEQAHFADDRYLLLEYADENANEWKMKIKGVYNFMPVVLVFKKTSENDLYTSVLKERYWPLVVQEMHVREQKRLVCVAERVVERLETAHGPIENAISSSKFQKEALLASLKEKDQDAVKDAVESMWEEMLAAGTRPKSKLGEKLYKLIRDEFEKKARIATAKAKTEQLRGLQECARQAQKKAEQIFLDEKREENRKRYRREYSPETRREIARERSRARSEEIDRERDAARERSRARSEEVAQERDAICEAHIYMLGQIHGDSSDYENGTNDYSDFI